MKANQTRWTEKWLAGGGTQNAKMRIMETRNYDEYTLVILSPIRDEFPMESVYINETGGVGYLEPME